MEGLGKTSTSKLLNCSSIPVIGVKNVKPDLDEVPPLVVIETSPLEPEPTSAEIFVEELIVNDAAGIVPKLSEDALVKFVPVIETVVPCAASEGVNEEIEGAGTNVKPNLDVVPPGVVIETSPLEP